MEKIYLIMGCQELYDQFECDCDRTPLALTDNWQEWIRINKEETNKYVEYNIEVWEQTEDGFKVVKPWGEAYDTGMALIYYRRSENKLIAHVVRKFSNLERCDNPPEFVKSYLEKHTNFEAAEVDTWAELKQDGFIGGFTNTVDEDIIYYYCEYWDYDYRTE